MPNLKKYRWRSARPTVAPLEERALMSAVASPTLITKASPAIILDNATTPPTLTDTAQLASGNNETGTITFTLKVAPKDTTIPTRTVQTIIDKVVGDGLYSANYTMPANYQTEKSALAGNYTWTASYSGDSLNKPANDQGGTAEQTAVETATVYATYNAQPVTQYWYYTAPASAAARRIGFWGTNPNYPPPTVSTGQGTYYPTWMAPTYTSAVVAPAPAPTPAPDPVEVIGAQIEARMIVLQLSGPVNATTANNIHSYSVTHLGKRMGLISARYNASNNTIQLRTKVALPARLRYGITITTPGLRDAHNDSLLFRRDFQ